MWYQQKPEVVFEKGSFWEKTQLSFGEPLWGWAVWLTKIGAGKEGSMRIGLFCWRVWHDALASGPDQHWPISRTWRARSLGEERKYNRIIWNDDIVIASVESRCSYWEVLRMYHRSLDDNRVRNVPTCQGKLLLSQPFTICVRLSHGGMWLWLDICQTEITMTWGVSVKLRQLKTAWGAVMGAFLPIMDWSCLIWQIDAEANFISTTSTVSELEAGYPLSLSWSNSLTSRRDTSCFWVWRGGSSRGSKFVTSSLGLVCLLNSHLISRNIHYILHGLLHAPFPLPLFNALYLRLVYIFSSCFRCRGHRLA